MSKIFLYLISSVLVILAIPFAMAAAAIWALGLAVMVGGFVAAIPALGLGALVSKMFEGSSWTDRLMEATVKKIEATTAKREAAKAEEPAPEPTSPPSTSVH